MPDRIAAALGERLPLAQLRHLDGNPRRGDHATIRESLLAHGQLEPIVVNVGTHTGRRYEIISGNNRVQVMRELGWADVAVTLVDFTDVQLRKAAAILNRTSDKATNDDRALADLLAAIAAESDLDGTGYDDDTYNDLMRASDLLGDAATSFFDDVLTSPQEDELVDAAPAPAPPRPAPAHPLPPTAGPTDLPVPPPPAAGQTTNPPPPIPQPPTPTAATGIAYMTLSWTLTPEQREIVRRAVNLAQRTYQAPTGAEALVALCEHYIRENTAP